MLNFLVGDDVELSRRVEFVGDEEVDVTAKLYHGWIVFLYILGWAR